MYESDWRKLYKTDKFVNQQLCELFPDKIFLREKRFLEKIKSWNLFDYVQRDIEVPENLQEDFVNFPPIFKNVIVGRDEIGPFLKEYADKERLLTEPRRLLISSSLLEKGTIITPLMLFYLGLGLVCK